MANPEVGEYLNRHFVSAFQRVATFQLNGRIKQGGNVASYFCTPDGLVLHAVAGPVHAHVFLHEATWANDTYQLALLENHKTPAELRLYFRKAHLDRLRDEHRVNVTLEQPPKEAGLSAAGLSRLLEQNRNLLLNNEGQVHLLLAVAPLPRMDQVYRVVFEDILNEKISAKPVVNGGR